MNGEALRTRRPSPAPMMLGPEVRRVRGCLVGNPGAGSEPARVASVTATLGTPSGSLRPCSGPWAALRHPRRRFYVPGSNALASGSAPLPEPSPSHLEPAVRAVAGMRATARLYRQRIASGPPGSRAIRTLLPGAGRCHVRLVNGPIHVPSQAATREVCHSAWGAGISVIPEFRASEISGTQGRSCQRPVCSSPGYRISGHAEGMLRA